MRKRKKFAHLKTSERDRMEALLNSGHTQSEIATILRVDKSTISRERKRKRKNGYYEASTADHKANVKRGNSKHQGMKIEKYPELKKTIIQELERKRSPDEIAGRMKREKIFPRVGANALYKWLYSEFGQSYCKYLCTHRRRKRTQRKKTKREMIPNRISIHDKPKLKEVIEAEGDTFLSPKRAQTTESGFLVSIVGVHLLLGAKMPDLKPKTMTEAVNRSMGIANVDQMIFDNGIENRDHENFDAAVYFCDPHSPWQKPHVECDIGLLRRWFIPKRTNLESVTEEQLQTYLNILNHKHRRSLGYRSAYEIAFKKGIIESIPEKKLLEKVAFH